MARAALAIALADALILNTGKPRLTNFGEGSLRHLVLFSKDTERLFSAPSMAVQS